MAKATIHGEFSGSLFGVQFSDPDLPADALSSKQFNTIVELLGEGEIEGSATAS